MLNRTLVRKALLPGLAIAAAAGAVTAATTSEIFAPAYGDQATIVGAGAAQIHASNMFEAADADRSGDLNSDEFAAMRLVTAELAHLNGFVPIAAGDQPERILLPVKAPTTLAAGERARITAIAYREFYVAAGPDARLSRREFLQINAQMFARHDRDGDGLLARHELTRFATQTAFLPSGGA